MEVSSISYSENSASCSDDWPTERVIAQLRELNIDTDVERFAQQAAAAGRFDALADEWVRQIPKEKRKSGFREDYARLGIPILWGRPAGRAR